MIRGSRAAAAALMLTMCVGMLSACSDDAPRTGGDGPGGPSDSTFEYAALGDSFTSAPGVPPIAANEPCGRSEGNYPHLVAAALQQDGADVSLDDVSCGGADTDDLWGHQLLRRDPTGAPAAAQPPQLSAITADTDLVTVGIGANDNGYYTQMLQVCLQLAVSAPGGAPCKDARALAPLDVDESLALNVRDNVLHVLQLIRSRAPSARIMVVNYPQMVPTSGRCAALPLARGDYAYVRKANWLLSAAVGSAVTSAETLGIDDVELIDVMTASSGHDICSAEPWVNGGEMSAYAAKYHPLPAEQQAVSEMVVAAVGDAAQG